MVRGKHLAIARKIFAFNDAYIHMVSLKEKVMNGEIIEDPKELSRVLTLVSELMADIVKLQKELGYNVGFPINENANFEGFSIRNGELVGDLSNAFLIAEPWITAFCNNEDVSEGGFYKFFVAAFIGDMAKYYRRTGKILGTVRDERIAA